MKIKLSKISTGPPSDVDKEALKAEYAGIVNNIRLLQRRLYAEAKQSLLVVMQGMDAAGKGGAIRKTFREVNPMGCRVYPFKKPTDREFSHDFLWRVHRVCPPFGMIHVFDRSYYEDVLIQRVHQWIDEDRVKQRFRHINQFEQLLIEESNTRILKFYLHVSESEQLQRLDERMHNPEKMWKYSQKDLEERRYWPEYRHAYEDVFKNCSAMAPWHIIPSDKNWYKEYMVAKTVMEALQDMDPRFPPMDLD